MKIAHYGQSTTKQYTGTAETTAEIKDIILTKRKGTRDETNIDRNGCVDDDVARVWG